MARGTTHIDARRRPLVRAVSGAPGGAYRRERAFRPLLRGDPAQALSSDFHHFPNRLGKRAPRPVPVDAIIYLLYTSPRGG